jgi:hypothetical protein
MNVLDDLAQAYGVGPEATHQALARHLADEVMVRHEPAEPADGVYPAAVVLQALAQRAGLFTALMNDYTETARLTQQDDEITIGLVVGGTLADGRVIQVSGVDVLTLGEGRIVQMVSRFDADQMNPLLDAIPR